MLCQMRRRRKKLITHGDTMKVKELKDFVEDKTIHWDMTPRSAREGAAVGSSYRRLKVLPKTLKPFYFIHAFLLTYVWINYIYHLAHML